MTKKKKITIAVVIAAVLLVGYLVIGVLLPRIFVAVTVNKLLDIGESASPFTHYDVTAENTMEISNGKMAISIPQGYIEKDMGDLDCQLYTADQTQKFTIILMDPSDNSYMNLLSEDNLDTLDVKVRIGRKQMERGFEKLGNGCPDSGYNAYKCIYMLEEDDYSFWDLEKGVAFAVTGVLKQITPSWGTVYMYDNGDVCGFVHINEFSAPEEAKYRGTLELYSKSDLNNVSTIMIMANTAEEIYAVANSARPAA